MARRDAQAERPSADRTSPKGLAREIGKRRPFESPEQEAFLNVARTAAVLGAPFTRLFREHGLSEAGYNVLRILRGASDRGEHEGRSCSHIGSHLIAPVPDVTRLVDGLARKGLVRRKRGKLDARVVMVQITPAGLARLGKLDGPVLDLHRAQLGSLSRDELSRLNDLLERARRSAAAS